MRWKKRGKRGLALMLAAACALVVADGSMVSAQREMGGKEGTTSWRGGFSQEGGTASQPGEFGQEGGTASQPGGFGQEGETVGQPDEISQEGECAQPDGSVGEGKPLQPGIATPAPGESPQPGMATPVPGESPQPDGDIQEGGSPQPGIIDPGTGENQQTSPQSPEATEPEQGTERLLKPGERPEEPDSDVLTYGNFEYEILPSGTARIIGYSGKETEVIIPSKIGQYAVTHIAPKAISSSSLDKAVIPESVQVIEADAFARSWYLTSVTVKGKNTLIADSAFCNIWQITFVCSFRSKAYSYAKENQAKVSLTDGIPLSKATIAFAKKSLVQGESYNMEMPFTVTLEGKKLKEGRDFTCKRPNYRDEGTVGTKQVTITAIDYNDGHYTGSKTASYQVLPQAPCAFYATKKVTSSGIQLSWAKAEGASGYYLYRCGLSSSKYKQIAHIKQGKNSYTDKGLKKNTGYKYRIVAYQTVDGKQYKSSPTKLTAYTDSGKPVVKGGKKVKIKVQGIRLKAAANTGYSHRNYGHVSPICDFFDAKGRYTVACSDAKYVYIQILDNSSLKVTKTLKIKKKHERVGSVSAGPDGNYYIVWGDRNWKSGNVVLAVSKYDKKGKFKKSCNLYNTGDNMDTAEPFEAGNCAVAYQGNILVCSYARQMNNVHQSNDVFCVNIKSMKEDKSYDSYASHSFDQRVVALANGDMLFADLGDAFPRGFYLSESGAAHSWEVVPFHFYGSSGDNVTNGRLGGIGEVPTGFALVGSSAPSMTENFEKEGQQLFLQIISPATGKPVFGGSKRKGTSCGKACADTGIKWLTKYKDAFVGASGMAVMEKGQILAIWEKMIGRRAECYYMVLSPTGKTLQKATKIGNFSLNHCEEIKYQKGCVYWTTANGQKDATVHKLYVGKFK